MLTRKIIVRYTVCCSQEQYSVLYAKLPHIYTYASS